MAQVALQAAHNAPGTHGNKAEAGNCARAELVHHGCEELRALGWKHLFG
jgi:hypothetical protein